MPLVHVLRNPQQQQLESKLRCSKARKLCQVMLWLRNDMPIVVVEKNSTSIVVIGDSRPVGWELSVYFNRVYTNK